MKISTVLWIAAFLTAIFCAEAAASDLSVLRPGLYRSYYMEELNERDPPATNTLSADGYGIYESECDEEDVLYVENYRWKVDQNLLVLEIYDAGYMNILSGEILGTEEPYAQYFEIIDQTENRIFMILRKNVYPDGSEIVFDENEDSEIPYIWDWKGQGF